MALRRAPRHPGGGQQRLLGRRPGRRPRAEPGMAVVCISGETDYTIGRPEWTGRDGHIMMPTVPGLG